MSLDKSITTALIAAGSSILTTIILKPIIDKQLLRFQLKTTYKMEQSKKVKDHIAIHKVSLLKSAEFLNNRLKNFSKNHSEPWLSHSGIFTSDMHYMDTTVYRFLSFFANISLIEKDLIYVDVTIAEKQDLRMLKYFRLFHEVMCDVDLFKGFTYNNEFATDHFFTTPFYNLGIWFIGPDNRVVDLNKFLLDKLSLLPKIEIVYDYFDGIRPNENRLRCERLKAMHLVLIAFLNEYGYDYQYTSSKRCKELKSAYGDYKLLENLKYLVHKFKLNKFCGSIEDVFRTVQ